MVGNPHSRQQPPPPPGGPPPTRGSFSDGASAGLGDRFFDRLRGLGIVRPDRKMVAGVCAALADRIGVDVRIVRVIWAVATIVGGPGLIAYLVGWLLLPQRDGRIVAQEILRGRAWPALFLLGLVLLTGLPVLGDTHGSMHIGMFIGLLITGFVAWLWWTRRNGCQNDGGRREFGADPGQWSGLDQPGQEYAPPFVPADDRPGWTGGSPLNTTAEGPRPDLTKRDLTTSDRTQRADASPVGRSSGVPTDLESDPGAQAGEAAPQYVASLAGPAENPDWRASYQSGPAGSTTPAEPVAALPVTPAVLTPVRRRPPGARVVAATAGLALVAASVALVWTRQEPAGYRALWAAVAALVVLGLATVVVGLAGRRSGMLAMLAIPALIVTGTLQWLPQPSDIQRPGGNSSTVSFGSRDLSQNAFADDSYQAMFGSVAVDYSTAPAPTGARPTISAQALFGSIVIKVPDDVKFQVSSNEAFGNVEFFGSSGQPLETPTKTLGPAKAQVSVELDLKARFGSIEIRQVKNEN